jgi:hypothetical protein
MTEALLILFCFSFSFFQSMEKMFACGSTILLLPLLTPYAVLSENPGHATKDYNHLSQKVHYLKVRRSAVNA